MTIHDTPPSVQAVRRVYENGQPVTGSPSDIVHLTCHPDDSIGRDILLWDDILAAFKDDVIHVRLDPLRIVAIPGVTLDVVVTNQLKGKDLSLEMLQNALPITLQEGNSVTNPNIPTSNITTANTARRNPAGGLVEEAMENYTHMENPATAPKLRGPQIIPDDTPSTTGKERPENGHLVGYQQHWQQQQQQTSKHERSTTFTQKPTITEIEAELGDKDAQYTLGQMYSRGTGATQNLPKALEWYFKAAAQGHLLAQYTVGRRFQRGEGIPQDYRQAMEWHLKAARRGHDAAQNEVGFMLNHGHGVEKDYPQAMYWYRKAADQGSSAAQCNIGYMYSQGLSVPQDYSLAMEWYRKAADQGSAAALDNIGMLYEHGRGVLEDKAKAVEWYKKAADRGHPRAKESLERLESQIGKQDEKKRRLFGKLFN
ncbi:hypothetical protein BGX24_011745 [Mortierella sp. AD032]|nr:hypothetical protein BGX24_011745 [Mortierella sp. AD032]